MNFEQVDYKTVLIDGVKTVLPKRIKEHIVFYDKVAVHISSLKNDLEFREDFLGGSRMDKSLKELRKDFAIFVENIDQYIGMLNKIFGKTLTFEYSDTPLAHSMTKSVG